MLNCENKHKSLIGRRFQKLNLFNIMVIMRRYRVLFKKETKKIVMAIVFPKKNYYNKCKLIS